MRIEPKKHWVNGWQVRGGYFWTFAFCIGKYGIMLYYPGKMEIYKLY